MGTAEIMLHTNHHVGVLHLRTGQMEWCHGHRLLSPINFHVTDRGSLEYLLLLARYLPSRLDICMQCRHRIRTLEGANRPKDFRRPLLSHVSSPVLCLAVNADLACSGSGCVKDTDRVCVRLYSSGQVITQLVSIEKYNDRTGRTMSTTLDKIYVGSVAAIAVMWESTDTNILSLLAGRATKAPDNVSIAPSALLEEEVQASSASSALAAVTSNPETSEQKKGKNEKNDSAKGNDTPKSKDAVSGVSEKQKDSSTVKAAPESTVSTDLPKETSEVAGSPESAEIPDLESEDVDLEASTVESEGSTTTSSGVVLPHSTIIYQNGEKTTIYESLTGSGSTIATQMPEDTAKSGGKGLNKVAVASITASACSLVIIGAFLFFCLRWRRRRRSKRDSGSEASSLITTPTAPSLLQGRSFEPRVRPKSQPEEPPSQGMKQILSYRPWSKRQTTTHELPAEHHMGISPTSHDSGLDDYRTARVQELGTYSSSVSGGSSDGSSWAQRQSLTQEGTMTTQDTFSELPAFPHSCTTRALSSAQQTESKRPSYFTWASGGPGNDQKLSSIYNTSRYATPPTYSRGVSTRQSDIYRDMPPSTTSTRSRDKFKFLMGMGRAEQKMLAIPPGAMANSNSSHREGFL